MDDDIRAPRSIESINQVIHILHNLNIPPQHLLTLPKAACRRIQSHLLLDETPILVILLKVLAEIDLFTTACILPFQLNTV